MASNTYKTRAIVLRKTKLGETDLIVTVLKEDGSLGKLVAKGARKPTSSFAARLELYRTVSVLCAVGRNLDIVKEARLDGDGWPDSPELEQTLCAAPIAELLSYIAQEDLEHERLFDLASSAFAHIAASDAATGSALCGAALLKIVSLAGFKPELSHCVQCGNAVVESPGTYSVRYSLDDGGPLCESCQAQSNSVLLERDTLAWCHALLYSTFDDIASNPCSGDAAFSVLHFASQWIMVHVGKRLKSLDFMMSSGLF